LFFYWGPWRRGVVFLGFLSFLGFLGFLGPKSLKLALFYNEKLNKHSTFSFMRRLKNTI